LLRKGEDGVRRSQWNRRRRQGWQRRAHGLSRLGITGRLLGGKLRQRWREGSIRRWPPSQQDEVGGKNGENKHNAYNKKTALVSRHNPPGSPTQFYNTVYSGSFQFMIILQSILKFT
jgi:hypothetical protein